MAQKISKVCSLFPRSSNDLLYFRVLSTRYGRVAKWLERLTAEQNIDGSSRTLGLYLGCSPTVHPAASGYLVATLGKLKAARKGTSHPTSLCRRLRISVPLTATPPTYRIVHGTHLYLFSIRHPIHRFLIKKSCTVEPR